MNRRYRVRFRFSQSQRSRARKLPRQRRLVDARCANGEGHLEAHEELTSVGGGRGENKHGPRRRGVLSACVTWTFWLVRFDTAAWKYYHLRLMSAAGVIDSLEFARSEQQVAGELPIA